MVVNIHATSFAVDCWWLAASAAGTTATICIGAGGAGVGAATARRRHLARWGDERSAAGHRAAGSVAGGGTNEARSGRLAVGGNRPRERQSAAEFVEHVIAEVARQTGDARADQVLEAEA